MSPGGVGLRKSAGRKAHCSHDQEGEDRVDEGDAAGDSVIVSEEEHDGGNEKAVDEDSLEEVVKVVHAAGAPGAPGQAEEDLHGEEDTHGEGGVGYGGGEVDTEEGVKAQHEGEQRGKDAAEDQVQYKFACQGAIEVLQRFAPNHE